ncbi:PTS system mannose/fructose/sorbose family transporter subunit IID [Lactobacillus sp. ESL0679]|uniref:PTS system mannose/fructose/sorbose family transporter subunit IID n=1 Tax=unclassified Lactobacillus TaxID=2620435 RepID=UPI0023F86032|nr:MULTISPECIES: PTS system mannose/fructose/sorbose family transporter subunit IID [unclassified Lactobacillus]MDF7683559.1 PTS system mannose/fructose/sorbose family transporter subunit IID [Lactobacillus sp. ESL0679]WEV37310.1 PTS system mannose/fructose/sorbose family transporter subunit IID [Lactobacillus sp. ESL0677]
MASRKPVLTKRDYFISILRSYYLQNSQNYGNMQGTGVAKTIWPELRKIYKGDEAKFREVASSNVEFYNTNPQPYPFVTSLMLAMYDSGQSEEDVRAMKMALMGPLAGIGDALSQFALAPLFSTIFASLALQGVVYAPIMFFICMFGITFGVRNLMGYLGWKVGTSIIDTLSDRMAALADIASTVGLTVISGLSVSFVKVNLGLKYSAQIKGKTQLVTVQAFLDKIMPYMLPLLLIFFVYWLITKKKWTAYKIILLLLVVGVALSAMGILVP